VTALPRTAAYLPAEKGVLAGILCDAPFDFEQLKPEDFFSPLHRRIYARLRVMDASEEPINLLSVIESMKLDEMDTAAVAALHDPLYGPFTAENIQSYVHIIKREARHRTLQNACQRFVDAKNDISLRAEMLQELAQDYLDQAGPATTSREEFFDSYAEFESAAPLSFAIEGFLQNDAITGIAGLSGDGKTWCALAMGRALLFGPSHLWDIFRVPERAEKVIYLIPESSRTPFKHRLQLTGLYDEIRTGRLLVRTLSKGRTPSLTDARLLRDAKNAHVIVDTAVRFMGDVDESSGTDIAEGLSNDFLDLLRADARSVVPLFHSPKSFVKERTMSLENMIRGSSEFGAVLATAWGIRQIDEATNTVHIQNLKPRDFEPCGPFQIVGRPYIDQAGQFQLLKRPGECGSLGEEAPSDYNKEKHNEKTDRIAIVKAWLAEDPNLSSPEMVERFKGMGITVSDSAVRGYRIQARKGETE
jgi:DnaB-like helicase N terminal domain/AAA domain